MDLIVDTGAEASILTFKALQRLQDGHQYLRKTHKWRLNIPDGTMVTTASTGQLYMYFKAPDGTFHPFTFHFLLLDLPHHDGFLGSNFLLNDQFCKQINNDSIHIYCGDPAQEKTVEIPTFSKYGSMCKSSKASY